MVKPWRRVRLPSPPPRVKPPTPVVEWMPLGVARPKGWLARSTSPQVHPPRHPGGARRRVDGDVTHERQVEHQTAIAGAQPSSAVAAAADGEEQILLAGEAHRGDHVGDAGTAGDQRRVFVDHAVVDASSNVVAEIPGLDQLTAQRRLQPGDGRGRSNG